MTNYYNRSVQLRRGELRDIQQFPARWAENAWRIALCLHAGIHGAEAGNSAVSLQTAYNAFRISEWFAGQLISLMSRARDESNDESVNLLIMAIRTKGKGDTCTLRLLERCGWNAADVQALAQRNPDRFEVFNASKGPRPSPAVKILSKGAK